MQADADSPDEFAFLILPKVDDRAPADADVSIVERRLDLFGDDGWRLCSPASLRGHMVNTHMTPAIIAAQGVARWDIEIAAYRNIPLNWVAEKIYDRLQYSDDVIIEQCLTGLLKASSLSPDTYRQMLIKNLLYMEEQAGLMVDWRRVAQAYPRLDEVSLRIEQDSAEDSFYAFRKRQERYRDTPGNWNRTLDKYLSWE